MDVIAVQTGFKQLPNTANLRNPHFPLLFFRFKLLLSNNDFSCGVGGLVLPWRPHPVAFGVQTHCSSGCCTGIARIASLRLKAGLSGNAATNRAFINLPLFSVSFELSLPSSFPSSFPFHGASESTCRPLNANFSVPWLVTSSAKGYCCRFRAQGVRG